MVCDLSKIKDDEYSGRMTNFVTKVVKNPLEEAIRLAKDYVSQAIAEASDLNIGHGQGPLWHFFT